MYGMAWLPALTAQLLLINLLPSSHVMSISGWGIASITSIQFLNKNVEINFKCQLYMQMQRDRKSITKHGEKAHPTRVNAPFILHWVFHTRIRPRYHFNNHNHFAHPVHNFTADIQQKSNPQMKKAGACYFQRCNHMTCKMVSASVALCRCQLLVFWINYNDDNFSMPAF